MSIGQLVGLLPGGATSGGLGAQIHTCWTFFGHSGCPLVNTDGAVVGMHNSWNEATTQRHAVAWADLIQVLRRAGVPPSACGQASRGTSTTNTPTRILSGAKRARGPADSGAGAGAGRGARAVATAPPVALAGSRVVDARGVTRATAAAAAATGVKHGPTAAPRKPGKRARRGAAPRT